MNGRATPAFLAFQAHVTDCDHCEPPARAVEGLLCPEGGDLWAAIYGCTCCRHYRVCAGAHDADECEENRCVTCDPSAYEDEDDEDER